MDSHLSYKWCHCGVGMFPTFTPNIKVFENIHMLCVGSRSKHNAIATLVVCPDLGVWQKPWSRTWATSNKLWSGWGSTPAWNVSNFDFTHIMCLRTFICCVWAAGFILPFPQLWFAQIWGFEAKNNVVTPGLQVIPLPLWSGWGSRPTWNIFNHNFKHLRCLRTFISCVWAAGSIITQPLPHLFLVHI
jgi:hypothetical protein